MSLLGSIAAALSEGVGGGMVQNAKWGEEKTAQAKKEAAADARLKEQLKRYDEDRLSREAMNATNLEDSKAARAAQAEENRRLREALEEAIHDADQTLMLLGDTGWRKRHRAALTSGGRG